MTSTYGDPNVTYGDPHVRYDGTEGPNFGSVEGHIVWVGHIASNKDAHGQISGTLSFTGHINGSTNRRGHVSASLKWVGDVKGHVDHRGHISGMVSWEGAIIGGRIDRDFLVCDYQDADPWIAAVGQSTWLFRFSPDPWIATVVKECG